MQTSHPISMASPISLPLYEKIDCKNTKRRALNVTILFLLFTLLIYRFISLQNHGFPWFLAFLCELWFTLIWILSTTTRWTPAQYQTYPEHLHKSVPDLPEVDMFVTTADPVLESPIITVNTVLSLLAVDYPAHKLACYVSDDACSPFTFYSLVEASKFAKLWVPFCKKYNVHVRAPFRYFLVDQSTSSDKNNSFEFEQEWLQMKDEYVQLSRKIEDPTKKYTSPCVLTGELTDFFNTDPKNHPTIIKVIMENKESSLDGVPHLVYISREKRPKHPHHYKAGAMNVLTRVSGLMTNAPFMLNVDCDMFVNNPQVVHQAMCLLLGPEKEKECGFVQYPQLFYDAPADEEVILQEYMGKGMVGIQGPLYEGTGCFHRRKIIYGLCPNDLENKDTPMSYGKLADNELVREFGVSKEFINSAADTLQGNTGRPSNLSDSIEEAYEVADCDYECGTNWGERVGWLYGSKNEDVLTGIMIHKRGWRSCYSSPNAPAFLGCIPPGGPVAMTQQKRLATGLLEILFSKNNPIFATLTGKLQFRQCLAYLWVLIWGLRSIPELCYAALPAYCIITNSNFMPKVHEAGIYIPVAIFVIYNLHTLSEYLEMGFSIQSWWTSQIMARIITMNAWLFALSGIILNLLGLWEAIFEVTKKDHESSSSDGNDGNDSNDGFYFDESSMFIPGTTMVLVHLTALAAGSIGLQPQVDHHGAGGSGLGEFMCSVCVVLCFWPFVKGLFGRGKYGIPLTTICKSAALTFLFVHFSRSTSVG